MPTEKPRSPEEPAESPRDAHALARPENNRESGARKLEERPGYRRPNPIHTGDRGDEPPGSKRGENPLESSD